MRELPGKVAQFTDSDTGNIIASIAIDKREIGRDTSSKLLLKGGVNFFGVGESKNEPIDVSYSNGSIINGKPLVHGKNFELEFISFGGLKEALKEANTLSSALMTRKHNITIGEFVCKNCLAQGVDIGENFFLGEKHGYIVSFSLSFASESAFLE